MKLGLPDDSRVLKEMFERFFATEATSARVRAAEPIGFDAELWRALVGLEAPFLRLAADSGGGDMSLLDACVMMEEAGRRLAPAPLTEAVVALKVLGEVGGEVSRRWIEHARDGETVLTLALRQTSPGVASSRQRSPHTSPPRAVEMEASATATPASAIGNRRRGGRSGWVRRRRHAANR